MPVKNCPAWERGVSREICVVEELFHFFPGLCDFRERRKRFWTSCKLLRGKQMSGVIIFRYKRV